MALIQTYATCLDTFTETETEKRSEKWKFSFSQNYFLKSKYLKTQKSLIDSDWCILGLAEEWPEISYTVNLYKFDTNLVEYEVQIKIKVKVDGPQHSWVSWS